MLHFDDVTQFLLANDYRDSGIVWTKQIGTNIRLSVQWIMPIVGNAPTSACC